MAGEEEVKIYSYLEINFWELTDVIDPLPETYIFALITNKTGVYLFKKGGNLIHTQNSFDEEAIALTATMIFNLFQMKTKKNQKDAISIALVLSDETIMDKCIVLDGTTTAEQIENFEREVFLMYLSLLRTRIN